LVTLDYVPFVVDFNDGIAPLLAKKIVDRCGGFRPEVPSVDIFFVTPKQSFNRRCDFG
jgi:hypothetical protein